jgi:UDP-N-acetylmuramoyl-tripeptide--D-alanyl-D-alanine ligase
MKEFSIKELARIIKARIETNTSHEPRLPRAESRGVTVHDFTGVSIDSRTVKAGDCFFAIAGENFDGHDFLSDAFAKGTVCAVVNKNRVKGHAPQGTVLKVNDTVKALGDFAAEYRRQAGYKVIAITGSVGKTTTRQIAFHVLSQHFRVYQSPKNFNNNIGLPLTLLGAEPEHQIVIAELGTNHPGEIMYLTRIAQPDIAVITNVSPAHLEGFGNLQTIAQEKLSITEELQPDGVLIINEDVAKWTQDSNYQLPVTNYQTKTFSTSKGCDYQVRNIIYKGTSSSFTLNGTKIELPLPGPGNIENASAAWAICSQFGISIKDFARDIETVTGVLMRAEVLQIGTLTVINDCYNANPASMKNALDILSNLKTGKKRRLVFVCGDMAELGQQSQALHTELGASIARAGVQVLLTVGKFAKTTAEAAEETAGGNLQVKCFDDTLSACNNLLKFIKDDDIILVKGSRSVKLELVIEKLKELFS